ncbi:MAG TPA: Gfo/Idh/MocA family oxidoreductase, partial [Gemmatimonadales bacterium]|nr:Gfo/Idh/MocA family oxidoreductase [Gemmatimonadales bacterium]
MPPKHRETTIGLVGCGRISRNHFDAIARVDGLRIAAVCDSDESRARAAGEALGVPWFPQYAAMLEKAEIDAVSICTPSGLHSQQGVLAARAGKHVITEKPMSITLEQADALVQACDAAGVHLFVVKQNRLNPPIQLLKRAVDKGRFGKIFLANTTVRWNR